MRLPSYAACAPGCPGIVMGGPPSRAAGPESLCPDAVGRMAERDEQLGGTLDEAGRAAHVAGGRVVPAPAGRHEVGLPQAPGRSCVALGCPARVDELDLGAVCRGDRRELVAVDDVVGVADRVDEPER